MAHAKETSFPPTVEASVFMAADCWPDCTDYLAKIPGSLKT